MDTSLDLKGRCRWSRNLGEPILVVEYNYNKRNILDVEKKILTLKNPISLDDSSGDYTFIHFWQLAQ